MLIGTSLLVLLGDIEDGLGFDSPFVGLVEGLDDPLQLLVGSGESVLARINNALLEFLP